MFMSPPWYRTHMHVVLHYYVYSNQAKKLYLPTAPFWFCGVNCWLGVSFCPFVVSPLLRPLTFPPLPLCVEDPSAVTRGLGAPPKHSSSSVFLGLASLIRGGLSMSFGRSLVRRDPLSRGRFLLRRRLEDAIPAGCIYSGGCSYFLVWKCVSYNRREPFKTHLETVIFWLPSKSLSGFTLLQQTHAPLNLAWRLHLIKTRWLILYARLATRGMRIPRMTYFLKYIWWRNHAQGGYG